MKVLYSESQIKDAINQVAHEIHWDKTVNQDSILYVCVLSGGLMFFNDLVRQLPTGDWGFVKSERYGNAQSAESDAKLTFIDIDPGNYYSSIFVVDDICDEGDTLWTICEELEDKFPNSDIYSVVLLNRNRSEGSAPTKYEPDYAAIQTDSDAFFAGYGMDDCGKDREIPFIYDCSKH